MDDNKEQVYDSIIDSFLADRTPDFKELGLKEAEVSGKSIKDRTHKYDDGFASGLKPKKAAIPSITSVKENWHRNAGSESDSLINELTMTFDQAKKEGEIEKKSISDSEVKNYIKNLLNQGEAPAKVAAKIQKLAELELFNHQMATDYLQRNAGMLGLSYLEPNTYMDKANPTYRHSAGTRITKPEKVRLDSPYYPAWKEKKEELWEKTRLSGNFSAFLGVKSADENLQQREIDELEKKNEEWEKANPNRRNAGAKKEEETHSYADGCKCGHLRDEHTKSGDRCNYEEPDGWRCKCKKFVLRKKASMEEWQDSPCPKCWTPETPNRRLDKSGKCVNCNYQHKEEDERHADPVFAPSGGWDENGIAPPPKQSSSNDCVKQHTAWKNAGIKVRAKSVKQINACEGCSYFKKDASKKHCNLYHLPVVANANELSQIVNNLTPGVPMKNKRAALVQIANREEERVQTAKVSSQTNITKTADARTNHQAKREAKVKIEFNASHVAKLHEKGVSLEKVYNWADKKFGSLDTSMAFRGFVQSLKKNVKGRTVIASADLMFLNSIGIRNEGFEGGKKCASCPAHFSYNEQKVENERGAMRVSQKFAERTTDAVRQQQKQAKEIKFTAKEVGLLHNAGPSLEKIFKGGVNKVGSVVAKKAVTDFVNGLKGTTTKVALSQIDCRFLKNKLGVSNPIIGASKCGSCNYRNGMHCGLTGGTLLSFPNMDKVSNSKTASVTQDGHTMLNEYDLSGPAAGIEINTDAPERMDVSTDNTFKMDI